MYHAESQKKYNKEKTMVFTIKYYPKDITDGKLLSVAIEKSGKSANEWIKEVVKEKLVNDGYTLEMLDIE
jgi:predicted HicB family RNase H-like nuclease